MPATSRFSIIERIEELRSRLSLIKSSFESFRLTVFALQKCIEKNQNPPLVYPIGVFKTLERIIDYLDLVMAVPLQIQREDTIVEFVNKFNAHLDSLTFELVNLQNLLEQRITSMGSPKLFEANPIAMIEYSGLNKVYNAVDGLTYELAEKILGEKWIRQKEYSPASLFSQIYAVTFLTHLITIPYIDCFRMRYWSLLAHEVAHISIYEQHTLKKTPIYTLMQTVGPIALWRNLRIDTLTAQSQLVELTCDCIGTYTCGPSIFFACSTLHPYLPFRYECESIIIDSHPPFDARLYAMAKILERLGILRDNRLRDIVDNTLGFLLEKESRLTPECARFVNRYCELASDYADIIMNLLPRFGVKKFERRDWDSIISGKTPFKKLSPIQVLNLAWYKRILTSERDFSGNFEEFFERKQKETKLFEHAVDQMYSYYLEKIGRYAWKKR